MPDDVKDEVGHSLRIATPKSDLNRIEQRLKAARIHYKEHGPPDIQGRILMMNPKT